MIGKEILLVPGAISGQGEAPIENIKIDPSITEDTETINFNEAKNLFNNLNTKELLAPDSLKYGKLTKKELLTIFGEVTTGDQYIKLEDIDREEFQKKIKEYAVISNYAYNLQKDKDSLYHHYIEGLPGYPWEEKNYNVAAEYDKKVIDLYSLAIAGIVIEPGENYGKLEPQIVRFLVHTLKKFNKYISSDQKKDLEVIVGNLGGITSDVEASLEAANYPSISEKERKEYKKLIEKMTTKTRYLTNDFQKNKTFELYFPITEKYTLLAQALAIITNNHSESAKAITIEAGLLEEKTRYVRLNQNENMQRAIEKIKDAESELVLVGGARPGQSENNIGEIYFNIKAYPMAMMSYEQSLEKKSFGYKKIGERFSALEEKIIKTTDTLRIDIEKNKKEDVENKISADKLDKYFLDYEDASKDFNAMISDFEEEEIEIHKTVNTEEFSQIAREISNTLKVIKAKLQYIKQNEKYIDIIGLEKIQKHLVVLSDLMWETGMITGVDGPYINIGKTNIVMGIQMEDEEILQKGKEYLDIAEEFQNFLKNDDVEVNYYLGEYYKYTRDFRKAQDYFLKVYNNSNVDIEYKYKAAGGMEFTAFTYKDKFERQAIEEAMKKTYEEISQRIQHSMNEYTAVVAAEEKAAADLDREKAENKQKLREKEQEAEMTRQRTVIGGIAGLGLLLGFIAWLISMRRKNKIIEAQKEEVEEKNVEVEQKNVQITKQKEDLEELKNVITQTDSAMLVRNIDGTVLYENEIYKKIINQDIISTEGISKKMFQECIDTKRTIEYMELVVVNIDPKSLSAEQIEKEKNKIASKYLFSEELGKELIREQQYYWIQLNPQINKDGDVYKVTSVSMDSTEQELDRQEKEVLRIDLETQKNLLEFTNEQVKASITYGKKIQTAMLPSKEQMNSLGEHFVLYKPKDIISGDFYWVKKSKNNPNKVAVATVDCTGHGVPGAMLSMLGISNLDDIRNSNSNLNPATILEELHRRIKLVLQKGEEYNAQDGMDMSLYVLDKRTGILQCSGAMNEVYIIHQDGTLETLAGTKRGINDSVRENVAFKNHTLKIEKGAMIYSHSDGFQDQMGGPKGRKFMKKKYRKTLTEIHKYPVEKQGDILYGIIEKRRGPEIQLDDMLVMGVRV